MYEIMLVQAAGVVLLLAVLLIAIAAITGKHG